MLPAPALASLWAQRKAARRRGLPLKDPWKDPSSAGTPEEGASMALAKARGQRQPLWVRLLPSGVPALAVAVDTTVEEEDEDEDEEED